MGLFKKILGDESDAKNSKGANTEENEPVFYADGEDAALERALGTFGASYTGKITALSRGLTSLASRLPFRKISAAIRRSSTCG